MIVGYIIAACFGMVDLSSVGEAGIFQIPRPLYFGMEFEPSAIVTMVLLFVINSVQAIGDFSATTAGGLDREPTDKELSGGIVGYGITNIFGSFFGGLPTATFSQNVGIVATTKVVNRMVLGLSAIIIFRTADNNSSVCAGRRHDFSVCLHCHDRHQTGGYSAPVLPQYGDCRSCCSTWHGHYPMS